MIEKLKKSNRIRISEKDRVILKRDSIRKLEIRERKATERGRLYFK